MVVIPSVNEADFKAVKKRLDEVKDIGAKQAHIDVSDGVFTKHKSWPATSGRSHRWNNPINLKSFGLQAGIHLMVENPDNDFKDWAEVGARKIIVHIESAKNILKIKEQCEKSGIEFVLAINPDTAISKLFDYPEVKKFLILAVEPGPSGQKFDEAQLKKIKTLRSKMPDVKIEVDGGINLKIAEKVKKAGADVIISGSYIWNSPNPQKAYEELLNI